MNARFKRSFVHLVARVVTVALITGQTGCFSFLPKESSSPAQPPEWNRVGVASVAVQPHLDARSMPRTHGLLEDKTVQGAAVGGAGGAGVGAAACLAAGPYMAVLCPVVLVAYAGLGVTLGGAIGTVEQDKDDAEQTFADVPTGSAIQAELRESVVAVARSDTPYEILDLGSHSPPRRVASNGDGHGGLEYDGHFAQVEYAEPVAYSLPEQNAADAVLEVTLHKILADGMAGAKDEFAIELTSRSRLIRISDGRILAVGTHYYSGPPRKIGGSAGGQTEKILRSIRIGIETLGQDIVADTLIRGAIEPHSSESGHPEFM